MGFIERTREDQLMFAYVTGVQDAMPTISDSRAIERFVTRFGHVCETCDTEALRARLQRMKQEYLQTLKS